MSRRQRCSLIWFWLMGWWHSGAVCFATGDQKQRREADSHLLRVQSMQMLIFPHGTRGQMCPSHCLPFRDSFCSRRSFLNSHNHNGLSRLRQCLFKLFPLPPSSRLVARRFSCWFVVSPSNYFLIVLKINDDGLRQPCSWPIFHQQRRISCG